MPAADQADSTRAPTVDAAAASEPADVTNAAENVEPSRGDATVVATKTKTSMRTTTTEGPEGGDGSGQRDTEAAQGNATIHSVTERAEVLVDETLIAPSASNAPVDTAANETPTDAPMVGEADVVVETDAISSSVAVEGHSEGEARTNGVQGENRQAGPSQTASDQSQGGQPVASETEGHAIRVRPASELLGRTAVDPSEIQTPSPRRRSKKRRTSELPAGSTPLREELERSREKKRRAEQRQAQGQGQGASSGRLSKRASSPDKVYAFVGLPPRQITPVVETVQTTPAPDVVYDRAPPAEQTPEERWESVQRGSRIVHDVAAQYRARITALCQKYQIGAKEVAEASNEIKKAGSEGTGGGLDWDSLEQVLAGKHGRL